LYKAHSRTQYLFILWKEKKIRTSCKLVIVMVVSIYKFYLECIYFRMYIFRKMRHRFELNWSKNTRNISMGCPYLYPHKYALIMTHEFSQLILDYLYSWFLFLVDEHWVPVMFLMFLYARMKDNDNNVSHHFFLMIQFKSNPDFRKFFLWFNFLAICF